MNILRLFAATILIFAGCSRHRAPESTAASAHRNANGDVDSSIAVPMKIRQLPFDKSSSARGFKIQGTVSGGARWMDANGENTLIVSEDRVKDPKGHDVMIQKIFGYLYVKKDSTRLLWKIEDQAEIYCDYGVGLASNIIVNDLDGDGVAENLFVYDVVGACDVSPRPYKLMLHSGARKFAVRGTTRVRPSEDTVMGGEKKFDAEFSSAPPQFREAAAGLWDKIVGAAEVK